MLQAHRLMIITAIRQTIIIFFINISPFKNNTIYVINHPSQAIPAELYSPPGFYRKYQSPSAMSPSPNPPPDQASQRSLRKDSGITYEYYGVQSDRT
jgi:hypothetical protein